MNERHVRDMVELTLDQVQNDGNKKFFQKLLKLRVKECWENETCRVIYAGDELAGFIRWNWTEEGAVLEALLIRDVYRGQGYMEELWKELLDACKTRGVMRIVSYAEKEDYLNMSFHEYLGFHLVDNPDLEKYIWMYDLKAMEEVRPSNHNIMWLTVPDIEGEL